MATREEIREQWQQRLAGHELLLPSGITVLVRPLSLIGLVESGRIPNHLFAVAQKTIEQENTGSSPDEIKDVADLCKIVVTECLVYPQIATEERPEDPPDVIGMRELNDLDILTIFNWSQRGVAQLSQFRPEPTDDNPAGQDSAAVLVEAVSNPGD